MPNRCPKQFNPRVVSMFSNIVSASGFYFWQMFYFFRTVASGVPSSTRVTESRRAHRVTMAAMDMHIMYSTMRCEQETFFFVSFLIVSLQHYTMRDPLRYFPTGSVIVARRRVLLVYERAHYRVIHTFLCFLGGNYM